MPLAKRGEEFTAQQAAGQHAGQADPAHRGHHQTMAGTEPGDEAAMPDLATRQPARFGRELAVVEQQQRQHRGNGERDQQ